MKRGKACWGEKKGKGALGNYAKKKKSRYTRPYVGERRAKPKNPTTREVDGPTKKKKKKKSGKRCIRRTSK